MKRLLLFLAFAVTGFAQVYTTTVTAPGSGYTSATIAASGGGCASEPTFTTTLNAGALASVTPTFAGTGCTTAPTLTVSGNGTGATATAVLLPQTITLLSTVPSLTGQSLSPSAAGTYNAWVFACWLTVPASRVQFYAMNLYPLPGTSQATKYSSAPNGVSTALASGILAEFDDMVILYSTATVATIEAAVSASCTAQQTAINSWNPWAHFGSSFLNGTWTITTIP